LPLLLFYAILRQSYSVAQFHTLLDSLPPPKTLLLARKEKESSGGDA